jgi:hypothetical protein
MIVFLNIKLVQTETLKKKVWNDTFLSNVATLRFALLLSIREVPG